MGAVMTSGRIPIAGYAAIFGRVDLAGDIIRPGAFLRNLEEQGKLIPATRACVKMLYQHAADRPVGRWDHIREDRHGLFVRGHLFTDTRDGRDLAHLLEGEAVNGLSIGFRPRRARKDRSGRRELLDIDLWEVSIVTFPMAPGARVTQFGNKARTPRNLLSSEHRGQ